MTDKPVRCAECDCAQGGIYCNWIPPDPQIAALIAERDRLVYVLGGVAAAIDTGRNEPLAIWREQIDICLGSLKGDQPATKGGE